MDDKNYADASERALLRVPDREAEQYLTLQEAKVAWTHLPDDLKARATIEVLREGGGGPVYTSDEIERLLNTANWDETDEPG
jgi:hypothetical protein